MRWVQCDGCDALGTINEIYCEIKGVIKTEPHGWESPQPYLMTVRPFQVYPHADYVRTRVDLGGANGPLSIASGTLLPCGSIGSRTKSPRTKSPRTKSPRTKSPQPKSP